MSKALDTVKEISKINSDQLKRAKIPKKAGEFRRAFLSNPNEYRENAKEIYKFASMSNPAFLSNAAKNAKKAILAGATTPEAYLLLGRFSIASRDMPTAINIVEMFEKNGNFHEADYLLGHLLLSYAKSKHTQAVTEGPYSDKKSEYAKQAKELYLAASECFAFSKQTAETLAIRAWISAVTVETYAPSRKYDSALQGYELALSELKSGAQENHASTAKCIEQNIRVLKALANHQKTDERIVFLDTYEFI